MDSQDYLDQISAGVRPGKSNTGLMKVISSKYFKWGMVALMVLIVIVIFGSMLGGNKKPDLGERCNVLNLYLNNDVEIINTYQESIKSSKLRSLSASLKGIFSNTSSQLSAYITQTLKLDEKKMESLTEEEALKKDELINDLFVAKINGILDRIYANKMTLEIYNVMSDEAGIIKDTSDENLKSLLTSSYNSLDNLYHGFNDFSETK